MATTSHRQDRHASILSTTTAGSYDTRLSEGTHMINNSFREVHHEPVSPGYSHNHAQSSDALTVQDDTDYMGEAIKAAEDIFRFYSAFSNLPVENDKDRKFRLTNMRVHSGDLIKKVVRYIDLVRKSQVISDRTERAQLTSILT
jgi:hypothetical protein